MNVESNSNQRHWIQVNYNLRNEEVEKLGSFDEKFLKTVTDFFFGFISVVLWPKMQLI